MSGLSRRRFLALTGGGVALAGVVGGGTVLGGTPGQTAKLLPGTLPRAPMFAVALPIPTPKKPVRTENGTDVYEVVQRVADVEIVPGVRTSVLGYDGTFPGPLFETRRDRPVTVVHRNELPVPTSVHLHGGHNPAASDGWPLDLVLPAGSATAEHATMGGMGGSHASGDVSVGSRAYHYPMRQRAAALWYHDHRMDFSAPQVWRGLLGMHLVRDDEEDALPLPRGDREIPLIITDRSFAEDGSLLYPSLDRTLQSVPGVEPAYMQGVLGDTILVNGAPWPTLEVEAVAYRFRVLNASNARRYQLALDPGAPLVQVGSDGGLLDAPVTHAELPVAPGERYDLVVDFSRYPDGADVRLVNRIGEGDTAQIMQFRVARRGVERSSVPARLSRIERPDPATAAVRRQFTFTRSRTGSGHAGWLINGLPFEPDRPQATPRLGDLEVWRFGTDLHHPVHVHLDPFLVLSRNGAEPAPNDAGWKDTVDLRPAEYIDVAVRFSDHAGNFLVHCHNLEHEDMAMMAAIRTLGA
jgi:spore coat protein A, manganese oxidase